MFPLKDDLRFARNQWYVAGWSDEIRPDALFERWILNEPVIFFRDERGSVVALEGRCPHRNYPLSKGVLRNGTVQCGYHGITFDAAGHCVSIPTQRQIPPVCRIRSYPVVEKWRWVWIWTGDPKQADPNLIPDHDEIRIERPGWLATQAFTYLVNTRCQFFNENLMDISHLTFLHAGTIGTDGVAATEVELIDEGRYLRGTRKIRNDRLTGFFSAVLGHSGSVDREVLIDYYPPGLHVAWEMFTLDGQMLGEYRVHHAVTPATDHTTNYFVAFSRTFARDDQRVADEIAKVFGAVIAQDIDATESIETLITRRSERPTELLVRGDAHAVQGRRKLEMLIEAEALAASQAKPHESALHR